MRYHVPNYLSNSVRAAKRFGGDIWQEVKKTDWANLPKDVVENVGEGVHRKTYKGGGGRQAYTSSGVGGVSGLASDFLGKTVGSDEWRQRYVWPYTNPYRLINDTVGKVSEKIPLSKAAQAAVAVGTPILYHQLTESSGPLSQGMRPKGWKAAVPASKEKDPTGKTPISLPEEAAARWVLGQKSQLLPYDEFKKERPDVMPSTLANYRGYMNKKPKPGERINVDTDKGSFTALGGAVRGTSRGLHDPEVRLKGVPISLNATLGTGAGLATIAAGSKYLNPQNEGLDAAVKVTEQMVNKATGKEVGYAKDLYNEAKKAKEQWVGELPKAAQEFQKLGAYKEPALLLGGALAAVGTAATARKLFQKAEERRIKKEAPVEYLKYKHGNFEETKEALGKPEASTWKDLTQTVI